MTGLRAGAVNNRQFAIYDKRLEVMQKAKDGWLEIWNAERKACGQEPLDLTDRDLSQAWRFELRLGQKQLRGKFEMHTWQDLRDTLGDAVIPPFLMGLSRRIQAAVFSFIAGVMPPMPMLGRSLL